MSPDMLSWCIVLAMFPLALAMTRLMIALGPRLGLMDIPAERRIHVRPIPRSGGLGVFITMAAGLLALHLSSTKLSADLGDKWLMHFLGGSIILVAGGLIDDRKGISAWTKLGVQTMAAVVMFLHNPGGAGVFMAWKIPWALDLAIHVAWTLALINAFNLIDGMDGLCAGLGLIALLILAALTVAKGRAEYVYPIAVMVMALAGFLWYNFHPARIFLGDTGSMLVGFFISSVATVTAGRQAVVPSLLLPLLVGGVPLLDVALAIWRRGARRLTGNQGEGEAIRIFGPDRDHLHHRLLRWGLSQRQAAFVIYGLAIQLSLIALLPILGGANLFAVSVVGLVVIAIVGLRYIAPVEFMASGRGLRAMVRKPLGCRQTMLRYFTYDVTVLVASAFIAWFIVAKALVQPVDWGEASAMAALFTSCVVVSLVFSRAHSRRWSRSSARDFASVALWMACGTAISFALSGASREDLSFRDLVFHFIAFVVAGGAILGPRCLGFLLQEGVIDTMHRKRRLTTKKAGRTALIYGAGDLGELFLSHLRLSKPETWGDYHFVGFIDDTDQLKGRCMGGFPIVGSLDGLSEVVKRTGANHIMICTSSLPEEKLESLHELSERLDLVLERWIPDLKPVMVRYREPLMPESPPLASSELEDRGAGQAGAFSPAGAAGKVGSF